jgi:hypothetical protein
MLGLMVWHKAWVVITAACGQLECIRQRLQSQLLVITRCLMCPLLLCLRTLKHLTINLLKSTIQIHSLANPILLQVKQSLMKLIRSLKQSLRLTAYCRTTKSASSTTGLFLASPLTHPRISKTKMLMTTGVMSDSRPKIVRVNTNNSSRPFGTDLRTTRTIMIF